VPAPDHRAAYGPDSLQHGFLRLPPGPGPFPVAVVIHGGCWLSAVGGFRPTPRYMAAAAEGLRQAGVATWNVEYRALGHPGGGWPGSFLDIGSAVDHLRVLAGRFPLDTTRVVTIGHSAGGHFALWAAARHRLPAGSVLRTPAPLMVAGAVSVGGPGDMLDFATYDRAICGRRVTAGIFGVLPDTSVAALHPRAREASPAELLPLGVAHRLVVGVEDRVVPRASAEAYVSRARAAGDDARYDPVPDAGHFDPLSPATAGWQAVLRAVLELAAAARR
jgi:acetyl esterase/lipase